MRAHWQKLLLVLLVGCSVAYAAEKDFLYNANYGTVTEDIAGTDGDRGVLLMARRRDSLATQTSTDGDYTAVSANAFGAIVIGSSQSEDSSASVNAPLYPIGTVRRDALSTTTTADGDYSNTASDTQDRLYVRYDHTNTFSCVVTNSTATTLTALGGSCVAPGASLSLWVTDIIASASVAATTTTDQQLTLKSGTGGSCGTATAVVWSAFSAINDSVVQQFRQPIKITANSELCWMHAAAGNKSYVVNGYIAP